MSITVEVQKLSTNHSFTFSLRCQLSFQNGTDWYSVSSRSDADDFDDDDDDDNDDQWWLKWLQW